MTRSQIQKKITELKDKINQHMAEIDKLAKLRDSLSSK